MTADGYSLDDKRTPLDARSHEHNNLPDVVARWWRYRHGAGLADLREKVAGLAEKEQASGARPFYGPLLERLAGETDETTRQRTDASFLVPKQEIVDNAYDLSINRYKEIVYEEVHYDPPGEIIARVEALNREIDEGLAALKEMLV